VCPGADYTKPPTFWAAVHVFGQGAKAPARGERAG
jgi:hypothetical protein